MASRKSKNNGVIASLLLISLVGGAVMGAYVVTTPNARKVPAELRRPDKSAAKNEKVHALVPRMSGHDLSFEKHEVSAPDGTDERVFVVNEYLKELHRKGIGDATARAIGIDVRNGTAHLDFNPAFEETYGSEDEAAVLNGILTTLGQFPDIDKVQFEIDGKPMDTLGNVDLTEPQPVIRGGKAAAPTANEAP